MSQVFGTLLFVYGIVFVLVCMVTTSISVCSYLVSHRRLYLCVAAFFFFDMLESSLVFLDEYLGVKSVYNFSANDFPMSHPLIKLVLSCGLIACFWVLALEVTDRLDKRRFGLCWGTFAIFEVLSLLIPLNNTKQLVFYALRSVSMLVALETVFWRKSHANDRGLTSYLNGLTHFLRMVTVLVVLVLLEDAIHLAQPIAHVFDSWGGYAWMQADLVYAIVGRNVPENILTLYAAYYVIKNAVEVLSLRFDEPPTTETSIAKQHADMRLDRFCEAKGISVREADVLKLMLDGKDNRNIAEELFISPGTVKAHVHAIYRKCGINNRKSLLQLFWAD